MPRTSSLNIPYTGLQTVEPVPYPHVRQDIKVNEDMFGAGVGRALQHLGSSIGSLGGAIGAQMEKDQAENDVSAARAIDTDTMKKVTELETEYKFKNGEEAVRDFEDYDKRLKQITDDAKKAAGTNKRVQRLVSERADTYYSRGWKIGFDHKTKSGIEYADKTGEARMTTSVDRAATSQDTRDLDDALSIINGEIPSMGQRHRWSPEQTFLELKKAQSNAYTKFIGNIAVKNPTVAQEHFENFRGYMTSADREIIVKKIEGAHNAITAPADAENDAKGGTIAPPPKLPGRQGALGEGGVVNNVMLAKFKEIESGNDPAQQTGSYKGLYQLSDAEFNKYGDGGNIFNAKDNERAAIRKLNIEAAEFREKYKRDPEGWELYLQHQQGVGGFAAHMANLDQPAWKSMYSTAEGQQKGEEWAKRAIWGNLPDAEKRKYRSVENVTSGDFVDFWKARYERAAGGASDGVRVAQAGPISEVPVKGMVERGNIDLSSRPVVRNEDGSISTILSMGVNIDGKETLIPTISSDGKKLTKDEAIELYKKTGNHLGKFDNVEDAEAYAKELSKAQGDRYRGGGSGEENHLKTRTLGGYAESKAIPKGSVPPNLTPTTTKFAETLVKEFPGVKITSGYRDEKHNAAVGGASGSQHIHGRALDLDMTALSEEQQKAVIDRAIEMGARGLGWYRNGIVHVDFRSNPVGWGPDTHSGSLGQTPAWFRERVASIGGKVGPGGSESMAVASSGSSGRVRYASLNTGVVSDASPIPSYVSPTATARVADASGGTAPTTYGPLTADTTIEELNRRIKEKQELNTAAGYSETYNKAYEQRMREIHNEMIRAKADNEKKAKLEIDKEVFGDSKTGKEPAKSIKDITDNPNNPELRDHFYSLPRREQAKYEAEILKNNQARPGRRATPEDTQAFVGYSGMASTNPEAFMQMDFSKIDIDEGHRRQLVTQQLAMRSGKVPEYEAKIMNAALNQPEVKAQLRAVGITPGDKDERDDPNSAYNQFSGALSAEINEYRATNNGQVPPSAWIEKKTNDLLRVIATTKGSSGFLGIGATEPKPFYEFQFPETHRAEMEADFKRMGIVQTPKRQREWLIEKNKSSRNWMLTP